MRLAPNTISALVGWLTSAGLLCRVKGEPDGRTVLLTVTERARQRIAGWRDPCGPSWRAGPWCS